MLVLERDADLHPGMGNLSLSTWITSMATTSTSPLRIYAFYVPTATGKLPIGEVETGRSETSASSNWAIRTLVDAEMVLFSVQLLNRPLPSSLEVILGRATSHPCHNSKCHDRGKNHKESGNPNELPDEDCFALD